ncbi:MAG: polysaccharide biosynthesis protein [Desulfobacterium sp.]
MFRYTGLKDLWRLGRAVGLSSLVLVSGVTVIHGFVGYSRSVFIIDAVLALIFTGVFRLLIRFFFAQLSQHREDHHLFHLFRPYRDHKVLLIYGAGSAGEKLYREIAENPRLKYRVAGFLDDDPKKLGRAIHGIPVWGGLGAMKVVTAKLAVQEVLIAVPSSTGAQMRAIVEGCKTCDVSFRTLPGLGNIIDCKVDIKTLRDVEYKDLLRREPVELDSEMISGYLNEKVVMVTGAGGSIGSELCRQIIKFQPRQLILLDACESALYQVEMELKHRSGYHRYATVLGHIQIGRV